MNVIEYDGLWFVLAKDVRGKTHVAFVSENEAFARIFQSGFSEEFEYIYDSNAYSIFEEALKYPWFVSMDAESQVAKVADLYIARGCSIR